MPTTRREFPRRTGDSGLPESGGRPLTQVATKFSISLRCRKNGEWKSAAEARGRAITSSPRLPHLRWLADQASGTIRSNPEFDRMCKERDVLNKVINIFLEEPR